MIIIYQVYSSANFSLLHINNMGLSKDPKYTSSGASTRNSFFIYYVLNGKGIYNGRTLSQGQGFLVAPEQIIKFSPVKNDLWELLWVECDDESISGLLKKYYADPKTQVFDYNYNSAFDDAAEFIKSNHNRILENSALLELFLHIYNSHTTIRTQSLNNAEEYLDFAVKYIHSNIHRKINLRDLADAIDISNEYLRRLFINEFNLSPKQYINKYRLDIAKTMLTQTDATVTEVAHATGFNTGIEFSKFFSSNMNVSPSRYRRKDIPSYLL